MLTTLHLVKDELRRNESRNPSSPSSEEEERIALDAIDFAVERIRGVTRKWFAPVSDVRYFDCIDMQHDGPLDGNTLWLDHPALAITEVRESGTAVDAEDYLLYPRNDTAKTRIIRLAGGWSAGESPFGAIEVEGEWCVHSRLSTAWIASGDSVANTGQIDENETAIEVADADGADSRFRVPRFSPGQLIRIDEEFMQIRQVEVNESAPDVIHVIRAMNGTTAAEHTLNAAIGLFVPDPQITLAASRWAGYLYQHRAQYAQTQIEGLEVKTWPTSAPSDVEAILAQFVEKW